jgi:hypothetical protein
MDKQSKILRNILKKRRKNKMNQKKLEDIFNLMQGITTSEWKILRICIDAAFEAEINKQADRIRFTEYAMTTEVCKRYLSLLKKEAKSHEVT